MSDSKAKMHKNRFWLGLCPRPRWGRGALLLREGGYRKEPERCKGRGRHGRERRGGKERRGGDSKGGREERGPGVYL